ncbi:MAG: hypothetical protein CXT78_10680 [Thaumarchaeota archaeon]|nr:MAG: hypothetical protein CXT78_10680 [Nitrososphaerota archaeon]
MINSPKFKFKKIRFHEIVPMNIDNEFEKKYREKMIKAKEKYDEMKIQEGDSDLIFNEKDYKKNQKI